jgi:hypothetical protein
MHVIGNGALRFAPSIRLPGVKVNPGIIRIILNTVFAVHQQKNQLAGFG